MIINFKVEEKVNKEGIFSLNMNELRDYYYNYCTPDCSIQIKNLSDFRFHYRRNVLIFNALVNKGFTPKEAWDITMNDWTKNVDNYKSQNNRYIIELIYDT